MQIFPLKNVKKICFDRRDFFPQGQSRDFKWYLSENRGEEIFAAELHIELVIDDFDLLFQAVLAGDGLLGEQYALMAVVGDDFRKIVYGGVADFDFALETADKKGGGIDVDVECAASGVAAFEEIEVSVAVGAAENFHLVKNRGV